MKNPKQKKYTPLLAALATLIVLLAAVVLLWLAEVRPQVTKGRSEIITDFLRAELIHDGETAEQVFTYDKDLLTIGLEFYLPGEQPSGALEVVLYDADTGAELSRSVGTMNYIVPDQYTTLGLDPAVTGREGRRYRLTVTPHYTTDAILAVGHSDGVALWKEQMSVSGRAVDGTMAMQITYQRIGGYLTRFFLLVGGLAAVLAALALGLSTLEGLFPISLLVPLPGVKLGLANIVTVFALYQLGAGAALAILLTRCLLGGLFAGNLSAMLFSVLGGLTAMLVMIFLRRLPKLSVYGVSIGGAAAHNIGQMAAAVITLGSTMVLGYLPFLLAVSLFTGALTGFITALLLRATRHIRFH